MVSGQARKRKAVEKTNTQSHVIFLVLLAIFVATFTMIGCLVLFSKDGTTEEIVSIEPDESASDSSETTDTEVKKIDFQPVVDDWVKSISGNKSILIYDLERDEIAASYNVVEDYNTASLYKLFVVYEGYRKLENGEWQSGDPAGSTGYTILECLDLAIRESYSPCAETLWANIGHSELDEIVENDFDITNSDISHLTSNADDITKMMKLFYTHPDITNATFVAQIKDSMLDQPVTTYDWRQGLPSGFTRANVYNKVGWDYNPDGKYWNVYHDAAIVEFPEEDRHFIVVVMTNKVPYQQIKNFGTKLEETFFNTY
ncbi:serine hydrolase [Candidatus Saccharibacteria bacterium]|nr:serine hydrolase [Candidatus Saccharibacteria bacterium]